MKICQLTAAEIMHSEIVTLHPYQKLLDAKKIFEKKQFHHHIPVVENGHAVGMISMTDFLHAIGDAGLNDNEAVYNEKTVSDIMSLNPVCLPPSAKMKEILSILSKGEFHSVLVQENEKLAGIITSTDILKLLASACTA